MIDGTLGVGFAANVCGGWGIFELLPGMPGIPPVFTNRTDGAIFPKE